MADARILQVCDAIVNRVALAWVPVGSDAVSREYLTPVKTDNLEGRKVYVFPATYADEPADRAHDQREARVALLVVERFTQPGAPTKVWIDERVNFVEQQLWDILTDPRAEPLLGNLWPHMGDVLVYDVEMLSQKKVFWSEVEITLREII